MEVTETTSTELGQYRSTLSNWEERLFATNEGQAFITNLSELATEIASTTSLVGNAHPVVDGEATDTDYILRYEWPSQQKDLLLLLRDIGISFIDCEQRHPDKIQNLQAQNRKLLRTAIETTSTYLEDRLASMEADEKALKKQRYDWSLLNDNWPTIQTQVATVDQQIRRLQEDRSAIAGLGTALQEINSQVATYITKAEQVLRSNDETIDHAAELISDNSKAQKFGKIAQALEQYEELLSSKPVFAQLSASLDEQLKQLPNKYNYPIGTLGTEVLVREGSMGKEAKQWLVAEAYPLIYEIDDIMRAADNDRNMAVINLRNRANLLAKKMEEGNLDEQEASLFGGTIDTYRDKSVLHKSELQEIVDELRNRVSRATSIDRFYNREARLFDISIESSIKQIGLRQNQLYLQGRDWVTKRFSALTDLLSNIEDENTLSLAEKVSRKIQQLDNPLRSRSYANIFLTKGYIGQSFVVGRDAEIERINATYQGWLKGYRGTVLLSGHRKSGRTLMAQMVSTTLFPKKTVRLVPGMSFTVAGRSYQCTTNLQAALAHIVKYGLQEDLCVVLDNIELWHDDQTTLLTNMRSLLKTMDSCSDKLFFVVTTTHWVSNFLQQHLRWRATYQLIINLDSLKGEDVAKAIAVRHSATHKVLIEPQTGEKISAYKFRKRCSRLHKRSGGIIGETLNLWANTIYDLETSEEHVKQAIEKHHQLPNIVDASTGPVLTALLMYRKINEYQLNKLMGRGFNDRYRPIIKRFSQMGVLKRKVDGRLNIHSLLVNDIAKQLDSEQWLNQDYS